MALKVGWHESKLQNVRQLTSNKKGNLKRDGAGRGYFQFEGEFGEDKGFETAVNRARNAYEGTTEPVPTWLANIKKGDDAMSLTFEQQSTLFLYDKLAREGADLGMVLNKPKGPQRDKALKSLWLNYHWANAAKQPELVPVREKQWDESMKTFDLAKAKELVKK